MADQLNPGEIVPLLIYVGRASLYVQVVREIPMALGASGFEAQQAMIVTLHALLASEPPPAIANEPHRQLLRIGSDVIEFLDRSAKAGALDLGAHADLEETTRIANAAFDRLMEVVRRYGDQFGRLG